MNDQLLVPVIDDEVQCAIFALGKDKASGPDGFLGSLF